MRNFSIFLLAMTATVSFGQVNVASSANGGIATQSSLWAAQNTADKTIDGNRDGRYSSGSMNHTNIEFQAWWQVEFDQEYVIDDLSIWNRRDGLQNRLNPFSVFLYDSSDNIVWSSLGNTHTNTIDDGDVNTEGMSFAVGGVLADRLRVRLDQTNYLHLAEVEAYSAVPEPATMAILGLGGLLALKRRRK